MEKLYDRADIYDLLENDRRDQITKEHWEKALGGKDIRTILDVSIGTGSLSLPLCALGVQLTGSDLSTAMLARCGAKAQARGYEIELHPCDFRALNTVFSGRQFDCVCSTGNSLPYVENAEIPGVLRQMDALVKPGGWMYIDLRNWDKIVKNRERFYFYQPSLLPDGARMNLVQVWDHLPDGAVDFNLIYTFERESRIFQHEVFTEHYHPLPRRLLLDTLAELGYGAPELFCMPAQQPNQPPLDELDWYCVMARKRI